MLILEGVVFGGGGGGGGGVFTNWSSVNKLQGQKVSYPGRKCIVPGQKSIVPCCNDKLNHER